MSPVPGARVVAIEAQFHALIKQRAGDLIAEHRTELPQLAGPRPSRRRPAWFPVPGMYGGFNYWWEGRGGTAKVIAESWCRVVAGSGQRHEVTPEGARLLDEGFV
jgi:hypothetical protein